MKSKIIINKYVFINIIILLISSIISIFYSIDEICINAEKNILIIGWIINILFVWSIYSIYKIKKNILDFNIIFLFFFNIFCNGEIFLYTVGVPSSNLYVFKMSTYKEIVRAVIYYYYSLLFFCSGLLFFINKDKKDIIEMNDKTFKRAWKIFTFTIFILSLIPYLYILLLKVKLSILYGYSSLYTDMNHNINGIVGYMSKFFIPSLVMMLYIYKDNKLSRRIILSFLLLVSGINLIAGARGDALSIFVIIIIFYNLFINKFTRKNSVKLIILILIIMLIIPIFANFRSVKNKNFTSLLDSISSVNKDESFIIKTISELGGTMYSFVLTDRVIPSRIDYKLGESYLASILMLIPSPLMGGYSFASKAALDIWLQNIHKMSYGPGFSIIAETYYNFGYIGGIIFTLFLGMFYSKIFNINSNDNNKNTLLKLLSLVFLYNSLIVARFPFHNTMRNLVYMYIFPYICIIAIYNTLKKKEGKK